MPPQDNITQTGPQTGNELQQRNAEFSQYYGDYRKWNSYMQLRKTGYTDEQVAQMYKDWTFKNTYGNSPDYQNLVKMSADQRTRKMLLDKKMQEGAREGRENAELSLNLPNIDINPWSPANAKNAFDFMRPDLVEARASVPEEETAADAYLYQHLSATAVTNPEAILNDNKRPLNKVEAKIYNELVLREADKMFPKITPHKPEPQGTAENRVANLINTFNPNITDRLVNVVQTYGIDRAKEQYILDNIIVPAQNNPLLDMDEKQFTKILPQLSTTYSKLSGSKWLPEQDIDYHQLYLDNLADIKSGKLYKVQSNLEKYFGNIVEKYQPGWFESGGDELVHSKRQVFFEQAAAGAVENLMDFALVPAGLVQGGWNALVNEENFWEEASYLPSIAHDVAHNIMGDNSTAYGSGWSSATANSGYTIGTMAVDVGLMAIPYGKLVSAPFKGLSKLGVASERFAQTARALESVKANKVFGTANALNFGVIEGSIDAVDVRNEIIERAKQNAQSLPADQRDAYLQNAINEANAAYGRTMLEESLIVNAGTLLGLGFYGSITPTSTARRFSSTWQRNLGKNLNSGNWLNKTELFLGKSADKVARLTLGELLEEYGQGLSSGINRARAQYNVDNYATALHAGLGADYLADTHLGFMQGLERFTPQAWTEMDPENLTKQVILSTLLFRGLKFPGRGKSFAQIRMDNATTIGKIWDNIEKFSPIQTGLGQIISEAKSDVFDIENSLHHGFLSLNQDEGIQEVLQSQAALTDIGIQMQDAINHNDITSYQKLATAYKVAQALMLANARSHNTRFSKNYLQVLQHQADFDNLSEEDKKQVLSNYISERQNTYLNSLSQEEQIDIMKSQATQALGLVETATQVLSDLGENANLMGVDIRPLAFAKMLYELAPNTITENWGNASQIITEAVKNSNLTQREDLNQSAVEYLLNNYFAVEDASRRNAALKRRNTMDISQEDWDAARNAIISEASLINHDIAAIVNDDIALDTWRTEVYKQWSDMYKRILQGGNIFTPKQEKTLNEVANQYDPEAIKSRQARKFVEAVTKAKSVRDLRQVYNQELALNDERKQSRRFDVNELLHSINDTETKKKIAELDNIERAKNSLQNKLAQSSLSDDLKASLTDQVEDIANNAENTDALYDISNYTLPVDPREYDEISGQLQEIINEAKGLASTTQSASVNPVEVQKGATQAPAPTDLEDRDIDTAPTVNKTPITKLTVNEASAKIEEAQNLLQSQSQGEEAANDAIKAEQLIQEVEQKCPEGYKVVRGGMSVALVQVTPTPLSNTINVDSTQPTEDAAAPTFVAPENVVTIETEVPYEDIIPIDTSIEAYSDEDVRSITRIAVGKYSEDGKPYTFAIRDEEVQAGDRAETSYTDKNGKTQTGITGPLEVISIEEFNQRRETNPKDYSLSLEELANYARPKFVSKTTNQEVSKYSAAREVALSYLLEGGIGTIQSADYFFEAIRAAFPALDKQIYDLTRNINQEIANLKGQTELLNSIKTLIETSYGKEASQLFDELADNASGYVPSVGRQIEQRIDKIRAGNEGHTTRNNRTEAQQQRLDNNITPARNEISAQFLPKEKEGYKATKQGEEYTRLGDEAHRSIDFQLEEQGAFEYRNSGRLQVGDEIQFVVSEEEMPDNKREVVIWEVTKPKAKDIPVDSKFKGMQVLSVLDQTNMTGDRAALIDRIRKAYDEAGRPESFLYDKESFQIGEIVNGVIPFTATTPTEASSSTTIESTNLKKGLTKKNGKYGIDFWNAKTGRMIHFPVVLKQLVRNNNGDIETISDSRVTGVEDIKHEYASQNNTREVMLVSVTPTGYKAAHSVYVMRRDIEGAVDKYTQAIRDGELGKALVERMKPRLTDNNAKTFFGDFFRFNRGISERVYFDKTHNRLELGYSDRNTGQHTTLLYAKGIGNDRYVITEQDARNVVDDNEGRGFTFDEIAKSYLTALVQNETVGASVQINIDAIKENHSVVDALIEDGFLWAPNSVNARFGMENTGFSAGISQEAQARTEEKIQKEEKPAAEPKTAPVEKAPTVNSTPSTAPKKQVTKVKNDHALRVPRKKLSTTQTIEPIAPTTPVFTETSDSFVVDADNMRDSQMNYESLNEEQRQQVQEKGFTKETWEALTQLEKQNVLNC